MKIYGEEVQIPLRLSREDKSRIKTDTFKRATEILAQEFVKKFKDEIFSETEMKTFKEALATEVKAAMAKRLDSVVSQIVWDATDHIFRNCDYD